MRTVWSSVNKKFRVVELVDSDTEFFELCGDSFDQLSNPDKCPLVLKKEEDEFRQVVLEEGVYGYELQRWNPEPGAGWEHIDGCWGFIGEYSAESSNRNHYIVPELIKQAVDIDEGGKKIEKEESQNLESAFEVHTRSTFFIEDTYYVVALDDIEAEKVAKMLVAQKSYTDLKLKDIEITKIVPKGEDNDR